MSIIGQNRIRQILLGLLLAGFALRLYSLDDITFSPDDRNVLNKYLSIPFGEVLTTTTQHGYPEHTFANILIWSADKLGGQLTLLRWPGIWFSVLTLALTYRLVNQIRGPATGLATTFLLTVSYYHIFFSHQIRGYAEVVFFALASFYFLWQGMQTRRWRTWLLFGLCSALGIYNHFYFATLLATQGLIVAIWLTVRALRQRPNPARFLRQQVLPPLVGGISALLLVLILFAPLVPQFFSNFAAARSDFAPAAGSLLASLWPYLLLFQNYSGTLPVWGFLLFAIFAGAGIVQLGTEKPELAGMLLGWLIIPLLMVALGQILISWFYVRERYLIYLLPGFIILAGVGWLSLIRLAGRFGRRAETAMAGLSLSAVLLVSGVSLATYFDSATVGNWNPVSNFLAQQVQPTDMVLCEPYGHGWRAVDLPATDECTRNITYRLNQQTEIVYPIVNLYSVARYEAFAQNVVLLQRNPRLWVVVWDLPAAPAQQPPATAASFDRFGHTLVLGPAATDNAITSVIQLLEQVKTLSPNPATRFALSLRLADLQAALGQSEAGTTTLARARQLMPDDDRARNQAALVEAHLAGPPLVMTPEHGLSVNLGQKIKLRGYSLEPDAPKPGQPLELTLFWQALAPIETNYSAFLHLRDPANQTVAQLDFFPNRPTSSWWVGDNLHDAHRFELPPELWGGEYRLLMGLYNRETLERLPVEDDTTGENAIELIHFNFQ